jgi:serine/threonine-protein kinase
MEYVSGRSLKSLIRDEAPLAPARAIDLATQLLLAARYIHRRGIVHRDLKPDNAIVDPQGHVKLTDFGIAPAGESDITQTGTVLGTAPYMSREQAQGDAVGVASDLYSIGIILYELLTGRVPFGSETVVAVLLKHVKDRPLPPKALNADVTPELDTTVMRALEKNPSSRFADADAFIATLERAKTTISRRACPIAASRTHGLSLDGQSDPQARTEGLGLLQRAQLRLVPPLRTARLNSWCALAAARKAASQTASRTSRGDRYRSARLCGLSFRVLRMGEERAADAVARI